MTAALGALLGAWAALFRLYAAFCRWLRGAPRPASCVSGPHSPLLKASLQHTHSEATSSFEQHVAALRRTQLSRLGATVYLDHAGAALYTEAQLAEVTRQLGTAVLGNPHSGSDVSCASSVALDAARSATLAWCGASSDDYACVFTHNATAALKLVGELFPWDRRSTFLYAVESHTSVVGMREYALCSGASACAVSIHRAPGADAAFTLRRHGSVLCRQRQHDGDEDAAAPGGGGVSLLAFPGECNFSGARLDMALCDAMQASGAVDMADVAPACSGSGTTWMVMLDAAKQCATHPPDLRLHKPHFVSLSYYKIFGYPTGLGALLVRRDALQLLLGSTGRPSYWGGGTIAAATATSDFVVRRSDVAALEFGTAAFTSAVAIPVGFAALMRLPGGVGGADAHACRVASRLVARLKGLRHRGIGGCACVVYGWDSHVASTAVVAYGPTVAFNVLASDGTIIPPASVEQALGLRSISLRSGQFCNPGAAASALGLSCDDITLAHERGHACGDAGSAHTGGSGGRVMGALRASFGYCSLAADADALVDALSEFFLSSHHSRAVTPPPMSLPGDVRIAALWVYPLKGAAGWSPPDGNWPLTRHGLAYDRVWAAVDPDGAVLTQTRCPQLGSVRPAIDIATGTLTLTLATGAQPPLVLPLDDAHDTNRERVRVCGTVRDASTLPSDEPHRWLSAALGRPCQLVRSQLASFPKGPFAGTSRPGEDAPSPQELFVNEGHLLVVTQPSLAALACDVAATSGQAASASVAVAAFRPNMLLDGPGLEAYQEDGWTTLRSTETNGGGVTLRVAGLCGRCAQVCPVDAATGRRAGHEPLLTLSRRRMRAGRPRFGVLLEVAEREGDGDGTQECHALLRVGQAMRPETRLTSE